MRCRRTLLHRIEKLVPNRRVKAEQEGGMAVSDFGHKRLPDGRVVALTLEANLVQQDAGGAHTWH